MKKNKTLFTSADIENNLYDLAKRVMSKQTDTQKVTTAVSAYNSIIKLQALKLKAQIMLPKTGSNVLTNDKESLQLIEVKK